RAPGARRRPGRIGPLSVTKAGRVRPGPAGFGRVRLVSAYTLLTAAFRIHARNHLAHALDVYMLRLQIFYARTHASAFALLGCTVQTVVSGLAHRPHSVPFPSY